MYPYILHSRFMYKLTQKDFFDIDKNSSLINKQINNKKNDKKLLNFIQMIILK